MKLVDDDTLARLGSMSEADIDDLPFGVVRVDDDATIRFYSRKESELAGVAVESALGRNFFTQVAPCCNNRLLYGRFKKGVEDGELDLTLPYTFTYKMRPTNVFVQLHRDQAERNWILIGRR